MLTNSSEFRNLKSDLNFNLLLDVAHLKVSSSTLGLNFEEELAYLLPKSSYVHLSDNDGLHDLNFAIKKDSELARLLKNHDLKNKDFTLEVYDDIANIRSTYELMQEIV